MPRLTILRGDSIEREIDLGSKDLRIGRAADNDIVLDDPTKAVSRFHAEVRNESGTWVLIDLNSQNGTWVDGRRIQKTPLATSAVVSVGPYNLKYQDAAGAVPQVPPPVHVPGGASSAHSTSSTDTLVSGKLRAPVQTAAKTQTTRPPGKAAARPRPAPADDNIVARLARLPKPVLFGGFGAFIVLVVIAGQFRGSPNSAAPASNTPPTTAVTGPAAEAPAPVQPTPQEVIAKHLSDGKAMLERGDAEGALRDHFEQVLVMDPTHAEATELRLKAQEIIARRTAPPVAAPPVVADTAAPAGSKPQPPPVGAPPVQTAPKPTASAGATQIDATGVARNRGEREADWKARSASLKDRYTQAQTAIQRSDWEAALSLLRNIEGEQPNYQEVSSLVGTAQAGIRAAAQDAMNASEKYEKSGDFTAALAQLTRARQLNPALSIDAPTRRIREQMQKEGESSYSRARVYDARGRMPEALALYERATQLLPADHANRKAAEERLAVLRGKTP